MIKISPFTSLFAEPSWFTKVLQNKSASLKSFQNQLEARGDLGIGTGDIHMVQSTLMESIAEGHLCSTGKKTIYVYQQQSHAGNQYGIWAMVDGTHLIDGKIMPHENTLAQRAHRISTYRARVGLEGAPVLLCYRPDRQINEFIARIVTTQVPKCYLEEDCKHSIWTVEQEDDIEEIVSLFLNVEDMIIADGHHRLAGAKDLQDKSPQSIMALFVNTQQLGISSFTRIVVPHEGFNSSAFIENLKKIFYISAIPGNVRYIPDQLHRFGLFLNGAWFQLDLKRDFQDLFQSTDMSLLQQEVFAPLLAITDPQTDSELTYEPLCNLDATIRGMLPNGNQIIFTVFPITANKLFECAKSGVVLPPKSTFITPRVPYGLVMNPGPMINRLIKQNFQLKAIKS